MSERNYIERQAAEARKKAIQGAAADALDEIRTTVLKLLMLTGIEDDTATVRRALPSEHGCASSSRGRHAHV